MLLAAWLAAPSHPGGGPRRRLRPPRQLGPLLLGLTVLVAEAGVSRARAPSDSESYGVPARPGRRDHPAASHRLQECLPANSSQCSAADTSSSSGSGCPALLRLRRHRLSHCHEISLWYTLERTQRNSDGVECAEDQIDRHIANLDARDREVGMMYENFANTIDRYDCEERYSVMYNCSSCKEAYRVWLCALNIPYFGEWSDERRRPCRAVCHRVQQVCPYLLPADRPDNNQQYAGEPAFYCEDKDIPDIPPFNNGTQYGQGDCCFHPHCSGGGSAAACGRFNACPALRRAPWSGPELPEHGQSAAAAPEPWAERRRRRRWRRRRRRTARPEAARRPASRASAATAGAGAALGAAAALWVAMNVSARGRPRGRHRARTRGALSRGA